MNQTPTLEIAVSQFFAMTEGGEGVIRAYAIRPYWREREY